LQKALQLVQRDLVFVGLRGIRDELGTHRPALSGGSGQDVMALTRARLVTDEGVGLLRIEYEINDNALLRRVWPVLDRTPEHEAVEHILLTGVQRLEARFMNAGDWYGSWPPGNTQQAMHGFLPQAMEVTLTLEEGETYRRVFAVAGNG
jgi:general secretion pathway protein J